MSKNPNAELQGRMSYPGSNRDLTVVCGFIFNRLPHLRPKKKKQTDNKLRRTILNSNISPRNYNIHRPKRDMTFLCMTLN